MPNPTSPEKVSIIIAMLEKDIDLKTIAECVGMTVNGVKNIRERNKLGIAFKKLEVERYEMAHRPVYETEEQARAFAAAMNGQTYRSISTKSYGRMGMMPSAHVNSESNLARCG